jgi:hypothetical protein
MPRWYTLQTGNFSKAWVTLPYWLQFKSEYIPVYVVTHDHRIALKMQRIWKDATERINGLLGILNRFSSMLVEKLDNADPDLQTMQDDSDMWHAKFKEEHDNFHDYVDEQLKADARLPTHAPPPPEMGKGYVKAKLLYIVGIVAGVIGFLIGWKVI